MAGRRAKPVSINSKHLTPEEISKRKASEERLKGNDNKVYEVSEELNSDEKEAYTFLVTELNASKILSNLDIILLEQTVECMVQMKKIKKEMSKEKDLFKRKDFLSMYKDYFNLYLKCSAELGLSPASRAKIAVSNSKDNLKKSDPLLKVLNK
jgi:P27 family predicted phage terminase small subunit